MATPTPIGLDVWRSDPSGPRRLALALSLEGSYAVITRSRRRRLNLGLAVALGGALGAFLRYVVSGWVQKSASIWTANERFPLGTFLVNLSGCLCIGLLVGLLSQRVTASPALRCFLFIGVLGSYTTFSTYALESLKLIQDGDWGLAALNAIGSPVLGLSGVWLGSLILPAAPV